MTMVTDKGFKYISDKLIANGFKAYLVGGAVRDFLLKKKCHDLDIATSALPEQICSVFSKEKKVLSGLKHGTVGVICFGKIYEVTTFRKDNEYLDHRRPSSVEFVSDLKEDLARRDFTVNALAYSEKEGIIDYFGGTRDLKNKTIRCVNDPSKRFKEDALRILRAMRFSSQLSFKVDFKTEQAVFNDKELLKSISAERITEELYKILTGNNVYEVLTKFREVIAVIIPEIVPCFDFEQRSVFHSLTVYEHIAKSVEMARRDKTIRLALLLHDIGKPNCFTLDEKGRGHFYGHPKVSVEIAKPVLKRLKVDKETYFTVLKLIERHDEVLPENAIAVKTALRELGDKKFGMLLSLQEADTKAHSKKAIRIRLKHLNEIKRIYSLIKSENQCYSLKMLAVNGDDLNAIGISGKQTGETLNFLLDAVINEKVKNIKEDLINFLNDRA